MSVMTPEVMVGCSDHRGDEQVTEVSLAHAASTDLNVEPEAEEREAMPTFPSADPETGAPPPRCTVKEKVERCMIHADQPIENLPEIKSVELASIGRCVTLTTDTTIGTESELMVYMGLVGLVTSETLSLVHCHRYTQEEFEELFRDEHPSDADGNAFAEMRLNADGEAVLSNYTADGDVSHLLLRMVSTELCDAQKLKEKCFLGPIPFISLSRKQISVITFCSNPPSSFYSLFFNPDKKFFDMQCLRMFVRRYLVHTSQGNNPDGIPLRAFIVCRCNCPQIENALLETVAKEELESLLHLEAKIESKHRVRIGRRGGLQTMEGSNVLQLVLNNMGIPRLSFMMGLAEILAALMTLCFFLVGYVMCGSVFIQGFMRDNWTLLFGNPLVIGALGLLGIHHSRVMVLPYSSQVCVSIIRITLCISVSIFLVLTGEVLVMFIVKDGIKEWVNRCDSANTFTESDKQDLYNSLYYILVPAAGLNFSLALMTLFDLTVTGITFHTLRKLDRIVSSGGSVVV